MRLVCALLPSLALAAAAATPSAQTQPQRFAEAHLMFPAGDGPNAFAGADVDGDGDRDLISADSPGLNRLALNDGTGSFTDATAKLGPGSAGGVDVELADVDGDGDADAFFANYGEDSSLLLNAGGGTFTDASHLLPGPSGVLTYTACVALGDVDGDGAPDALLGNVSGLPNQLWLNDGSGLFTDADFPAAWSDAREALLADVDGDGDLDTIFVGQDDILLRNGGAGAFTLVAGAIPSVSSTNWAAEHGDVDADGDVDLLTLDYVLDDAHLFRNGGAGIFTEAAGALPTTLPLQDAAMRDFDGDGSLDVLVAQGDLFEATGPDYLFVNDGTGVFADASELLPESFHGSCVAYADDLDGDGDVDVVMGLDHQSLVWLNDGSGGLHDVTTDWPLEGELGRDAALGDVDGDGDLDAFLAGSPLTRLYRNAGLGVFDDATPGLGIGLQAAEVALSADVNGDGADDLLLYATSEDSLHLADGTGGLLPASPAFPADGQHNYDAAFVDSESDGDLDVLLLSGAKARHYRNDGDGGFTYAAADTPASLPTSYSIATGDVDGDGDPDALIGISKFFDDVDRLLLNGGTGVYSVAVGAIPVHDDQTVEVALTDVDGDGDLDAVLDNVGPDRLYKNSGSGVFADATAQLPAGSSLGDTEIAAADFDDDGDADIIGSSQFWTNDGAGSFTQAAGAIPWAPYGTASCNAFAAGDVDGDGDLDVVAAWSGGDFGIQAHDRLYLNLTQQTMRTTLPRLGKPYTLALHGDPFSAFFFAWGSTPAEIPVFPFGFLRLHPGALLVIDSAGLVPPGAPVVKTFQAPSDPFWVGVTVYWQALIGTPLRFTNLEATTFTNL